MGNSQPISQRLGFSTTHIVQKEKFRVSFNEYKIKGKRDTMEDYSKVLLSFAEKHFKAVSVPQVLPEDVTPTDKEFASFFGIFDGHSGPLCAEYVSDNLAAYLEDNPNFPNDIGKAFDESFHALDKKWLQDEASKDSAMKAFWELDKATKRGHLEDGCTALVCVLWESKLVVANSGDCRGLLVNTDGTFVAISRDHNPDEPTEIARIVQIGGTVKNGRINGRLGVSRGFGAFPYKDASTYGDRLVTVTPEIATFQITPQTEYLILATDGVWDKLSNDEVVKIVRDTVGDKATSEVYKDQPEKAIFEACIEVVRQVDQKKSSDNISIIVATFDHIAANTIPMVGIGFIEGVKRTAKEIADAFETTSNQVSETVEPKLAELNSKVRNSEVNASLKEFGNKVTAQTAAVSEKVSNFLRGDAPVVSSSSTPKKDPSLQSDEAVKMDSFINVPLDTTPGKSKVPLKIESDNEEVMM